MDPPVAAEVEITAEKVEETRGSSRGYHCGLCDTEVVHKIAQELLPGLASACVDNTTGGIFKSAGSIAADMRKEMVDYLTQRSETFVAEFILSENAPLQEVSEHPFDIITDLIDDFAGSKRNVFSRVSEWVLSDRRDDKIDDFVQEMEINGFWLLSRRESIASMLVKNVDYKNIFHCDVICSSGEEVEEHRSKCKFRPMDCTSEGCTTRYSVGQKENHEGVCPFMILPCEQKCPDFIMRRDMDRHCVTVCPMRLVNCAFNTVGCQSTVPWCTVQQHNVDDLPSHLLYILRSAHKEATDEDLKHRVEQIQSLSNTGKLARARDPRSLTFLIKDVESKLGPLEVEVKPKVNDSKEIYTIEEGEEESAESPSSEKSSKKGSPTKIDSPSTTEKSAMVNGSFDQEQQKSTLDSTTEKSADFSVINAEESKEKMESSSSSIEEVQQSQSSHNQEQESTKSPKEETVKESSSFSDEEKSTKLPKNEKVKVSSSSDEDNLTKSPKKETIKESFSKDEEESTKSPKEKVNESSSSDEEEESTKSPKEKVKESSSGDEQESTKSPKEKESSNSDEEKSTESPVEKVKESSSSDEEEESTKSPKEKVKESSSGDEQESMKSPKEKVKESSNSDEEKSTESPVEKVKESSSGDEEESTNSPKKETIKESSDGDEEESTKSPKKEKVKESSSGDEEDSTKLPSNTES